MKAHGVICGMSQSYADGLERLYIAVDRRAADGLPIRIINGLRWS